MKKKKKKTNPLSLSLYTCKANALFKNCWDLTKSVTRRRECFDGINANRIRSKLWHEISRKRPLGPESSFDTLAMLRKGMLTLVSSPSEYLFFFLKSKRRRRRSRSRKQTSHLR